MPIKRITLTPLPILALVVALSGAAHAESGEAPRIVCEQPVFDFGIITGGAAVEHVFKLRNAGKRLLNISQVKTTCGCTTAALSKKSLEVGEEVEVRARFSLKGRRGHQQKSVLVHSNDPQQPVYRLELRGTIQREIDIQPTHVVFRVSPGDPVSERSVRILFNTKQPYSIKSLDTQNLDFCTTEVRERVAGKEYDIVLKVRPDYKPTSTFARGNLVVHTDHAAQPTLNVPVTVYKHVDIMVAPAQLVIPMSRTRTQPVVQSIIVRSRSSQALEITKVDSPDESIAVTPHRHSPSVHRLEVRIAEVTAALNGKKLKIHIRKGGQTDEVHEIPLIVRQTS